MSTKLLQSRKQKATLPAVPAVLFVFLVFLAVLPWTLGAQDGTEATDPSSALQAAYQREFIFLNNEIRLLQQRLEEVSQTGSQRITQAEAALAALETEYLEIQNLVDFRSEDLRILEEEAQSTRSTDDIIDQVVQQAGSRLQEFGAGFSEASDPGDDPEADAAAVATRQAARRAQQLEEAFERSFEVLQQNAGVYQRSGQFFLENGSIAEGQIIHVGRIASFGVSAEASGTLAPAGGGLLRIIDRETEEMASAMATEGVSAVGVLPLFIYDTVQELVELNEGKTLAETVEAAGFIGLVIIVIGVIALVLIFVRGYLLWTKSQGTKGRAEDVAQLVAQGELDGAAAKAMTIPGALGRVLLQTVQGLQHNSKGIEDVISEAVLNEQPDLDRFRTVIGVFAAVAPLLGLLGTVTGMITTFDVITQFGTGDPSLLSGGISEALITTEFGLVVAIPTLLAGNLLSSWSDRITSGLEIAALRLVNVFSDADSTDREKAHSA